MTKINDTDEQLELGDDQDQELGTEAQAQEPGDEAEILRDELTRLQAELAAAQAQLEEMKDRWLRARADLENYRRRSAQELERAREAGLDSAVLAVLTVYDDLGRALAAATEDPGQILGGVEAVRGGLKRNLEALGIREIGAQGDPFDPDLHEALSSLPAPSEDKSDTIAEVFQVGFVKDERLVRPAKVVVYQ